MASATDLLSKNPLQFSLVVDYLSIGVSFRMAVSILLRTKEHTGLASVGSISEKKLRSYAGFVCAINLHQIKELQESCWTFSVAMDMDSHMASSYLDIQICFFHKGEIHNFHVLAIPMYTHNSAKQIFLHACKLFDVLCPCWQEILISVASTFLQLKF